jgi:predicted dehydrogenase
MDKKEASCQCLSRRDFVKTSAAATGTLFASSLPLSANAYYHPDDTIKIGLIGCGGRGTGAALQAIMTSQNVRLVAMADVFRDRLEESLGNLTNPEWQDWDGTTPASVQEKIDVPEERRFIGFEAYKDVIPLVDVVLLATPPGFRPMHFEAAVDAGKQVFMEKPVATDAPGVRRVLAAAEKAKAQKLNVVVGLQRHFETIYREWVPRLQDGMIGDILLSRVYWNSEGVWVRERQPGQTEMEYQMRNWYYFNWICGDQIVEQHIHNLDVGNWVKGDVPVRAQGQGGRLVRTGKDHGQIFDHHFVEFEYADGSRMLSQCRHMPGCMNRVSEAFHGTNGTAPQPGSILYSNGNSAFRHRGKEDPNPYQVEHDELFSAIAAGEYRFAEAERGAMATMTAILGRLATYSGRVVEWEEALNSEISIMPAVYAWDADPPVLPDADGNYPVPVPGVTQVV